MKKHETSHSNGADFSKEISRHIPWNTGGRRWFQTVVEHALPTVLTYINYLRGSCVIVLTIKKLTLL